MLTLNHTFTSKRCFPTDLCYVIKYGSYFKVLMYTLSPCTVLRIFLFEISDSGIILGGLIEVGIFGGIKNNLKIRSVLVYSAATILRKHYNQTSVCFLEMFKAWKNSAWGFWGLIFGPEIFGGFVGSPRDFGGGLWFLHPFDHPRHLKTGFGFPPPPPSPGNTT